MKKITIFLTLLVLVFKLQAMQAPSKKSVSKEHETKTRTNEIALPNRAALKTIIEDASPQSILLQEYTQRTNVLDKLAGKRMTPAEIRKVVFDSAYDFENMMSNGKIRADITTKYGNIGIMQYMQLKILKHILKDHPQAIAELDEKGLLQQPNPTPRPRESDFF